MSTSRQSTRCSVLLSVGGGESAVPTGTPLRLTQIHNATVDAVAATS